MILVDTAEPEEIVSLLRQVVPVEILSLNQTQRNDYYYGGEDGKTKQFGRVQAGELLGNIDSMEDELRRYYDNADENYQVIEGIISPIPITKKDRSLESISIRRGAHPSVLFTYKMTESGFMYDEHTWNISSSLFYGWIWGLRRAGIITFYTVNWVDTARLLVAFYNNDQKPPDQHNTLNRYIIPRITIKEQDPFIKTLMSLSHIYKLNIGEDKATKLAQQYHCLLDIALAEPEELMRIEGIGKVTAERLITTIGRNL